jgi:hypothetical protein
MRHAADVLDQIARQVPRQRRIDPRVQRIGSARIAAGARMPLESSAGMTKSCASPSPFDCHDREVIGWVATTTGISGEIVRRMMRRDCLSELLQIDGSKHAWFEDRRPANAPPAGGLDRIREAPRRFGRHCLPLRIFVPHHLSAMTLDLTDDEKLALAELLKPTLAARPHPTGDP